MKATRSLLQLALCLASVSSVTASWPRWMEDMHLVARQDDGDSNATPTGEDAPVETGSSGDSTDDSEDAEPSSGNGQGQNTATPLDPDNPPEETGSNKGNSTRTKKQEFPATALAGGVNMITPNIYLGRTLIKVGETATFSWNYTDILADPTAVDIVLVLPTASKTWTLTANMSFETNVEFEWDTNEQGQDSSQPLRTDKYNFMIKDSDSELGDRAAPGYLQENSLQIGIYTPHPYTPLSDFFCATCSAAATELPERALRVASVMGIITVLSFTWFVSGLGVI